MKLVAGYVVDEMLPLSTIVLSVFQTDRWEKYRLQKTFKAITLTSTQRHTCEVSVLRRKKAIANCVGCNGKVRKQITVGSQ